MNISIAYVVVKFVWIIIFYLKSPAKQLWVQRGCVGTRCNNSLAVAST